MTENTLILFKLFRHDVRKELSQENLKILDGLIDDLTWTPYKREMVEGYCGIYEIYLVDGKRIKEVKYEDGDFVSEKEFKHPQVIIWEDKQLNKKYYHIMDKLVKYIKEVK